MRLNLGTTTHWMALGFSSALVIAVSCGGKVVFEATPTGSGGAGGAGGMTIASSTAASTEEDVSFTVQSSTADGAPPCITCADGLSGGDVKNICDGAAGAYQNLFGCGCSGFSSQCSPGPCGDGPGEANFCGMKAATMKCLECLQGGCNAALQACQ